MRSQPPYNRQPPSLSRRCQTKRIGPLASTDLETFPANLGRESHGGDPPVGNGAPYRRSLGDGVEPELGPSDPRDGYFEWEVGGYYALRERGFEAMSAVVGGQARRSFEAMDTEVNRNAAPPAVWVSAPAESFLPAAGSAAKL